MVYWGADDSSFFIFYFNFITCEDEHKSYCVHFRLHGIIRDVASSFFNFQPYPAAILNPLILFLGIIF